MNKKLTRLFLGAFALTMTVVQPVSSITDQSALSTVVTAEAAAAKPGKVKLKSIKPVTNNKIQITWKKTSGATHYRIYYKKYGTRKWTLLKTVSKNETSYAHTSSKKYPIECGQKYSYTVRAYSSKTKQLGSYDTKGLTVRTVPTTVKLKGAKASSDKTSVKISWSKAYGGDCYRVYRKTPGAEWQLIGTVKSNVFSYTDKNPVKGKKNTYTVRMYNSSTKAAGSYNTKGKSVTIPDREPEVTPVPETESEAEVTPEPETEAETDFLDMSFEEMEQEIIRLANEERIKRGISPLQYSQKLHELAQIRASQYYRTGADGEILGPLEFCYINDKIISPEMVVNTWKQDTRSKYFEFILWEDLSHTAVSIYKAPDGKIYWIQFLEYFDPTDRDILTISLDTQGGTCRVDSIMIFRNCYIKQDNLPITTREGYTFKGWSQCNDNIPFSNEFSIPMWDVDTLYAVWEPIS